jgi:pimeloyl-ACP methyl ester carboxylesterase
LQAYKSSRRAGYAISAVDATPLYFELSGRESTAENGPEARVPIVLCDGIGCDGFIWKYLKPALGEHRGVVRWHYRGHGRSRAPKNPREVSIQTLADDLASVLDDVDIDQAIIAGHSMGVQVALEFQRRYRYRTKGLVLLCGAYGQPLQTFKGSDMLELALPALQRTVAAAPGLFGSIGRAVLTRDWVYKIAAKFEIQEELLSQQDFMPYMRGLSQMDPALFLAMLAEAAQHSSRDFLGEIRVPTLVVAGELDTFTPPDLSREMARLIPGAELCIVHDGTHSTPLEHRDLVGTVTNDFLSRLTPVLP